MAHKREIKGYHYACWVDPSGKQKTKSCGKGARGKALAEQKCRQVEAQLLLGDYNDPKKKLWGTLGEDGRPDTSPPRDMCEQTFLQEYDEKKLQLKAISTRRNALDALGHFTRILRPRFVFGIDAKLIDQFTATRAKELGKDKANKVQISPATVNKDLRTIRAALRCAFRWGYLPSPPDVQFLREEQKEKDFIPEDQFILLYQAADVANRPLYDGGKESKVTRLKADLTPGQFWQGLMIFLFMTGWRINQALKLTWADIDLDKGAIYSAAKNTKGRRDVKCKLHEGIAVHLRIMRNAFKAEIDARNAKNGVLTMNDDELNRLRVFPLNGKGIDSLYHQFEKIQDAAGVHPDRERPYYAFHDLRRGFATENAESLDLFELQKLMQHKSLATTQRYVAMAQRVNYVAKLKVPGIVMPVEKKA